MAVSYRHTGRKNCIAGEKRLQHHDLFHAVYQRLFQPRKEIDRPRVVPEGAVNFAFIGQFAETPRDTIFTTEYSMRTGMESVYTLLDIDRGVPEVWGSKYDVRELLRACYYAIDKKPLTDEELSFVEKKLLKIVLKKVKGTDIEILLKNSGLIE